MNRRVLRADLLLLIAAAIWGGAFVAQRVGMRDVGPFLFNGIRFALGAAVLWPLARRRPIVSGAERPPQSPPEGGADPGPIRASDTLASPGSHPAANPGLRFPPLPHPDLAPPTASNPVAAAARLEPPPCPETPTRPEPQTGLPDPVRSDLRQSFVRAALGLGGLLFCGASFQQIGLVYTTAGKAGFITGLYVVFVPLLGRGLGQRIDGGTWCGAVLAAIGLYLLSVTEAFSIALGDLLELIGALFWAAHVLLIAAVTRRFEPLHLAVGQFVVCSGLSLITAGAVETISALNLWAAAIPIAYGGLISVGVGYTLQMVAQRDAPPAHAAILLSLEAVFSAVAGWWWLAERLSDRALIGCALMLLGTIIAQLWPLVTGRSAESGHG